MERLTVHEMIDAINGNYPPRQYAMLRESLDHAIYLMTAEAEGRLLALETAPRDSYKGLKRKYIVFKSDSGEPVENCFVLRPDKDPAAKIAMEAYAKATDNKTLADDITRWIGDSGKVLVLPCKVGETVYAIKGRDVFEAFVVSFHWHEWQDGFEMGLLFDHRKTNGVYNYPVGDWGKTVFPTREEAWATLNGGKP